MEIKVLYEDEHILVVVKPPGVVSNRAETVKSVTMQDWMYERYKELWDTYNVNSDDDKYFVERVGLVHRLDKETSGVMVWAKSVKAFVGLLASFKAREVKKDYIALTHGIWRNREGEISLPIGRIRSNRKKFGIRPDGRESHTDYKVLGKYLNYNFTEDMQVDTRGYSGMSLVRFMPKTGRTHQIRVHSSHMAHAVVGDYLYAGRKRAKQDRKWCKRTLLHAARISLKHPVDGNLVEYEDEGKEILVLIDKYLS